MKMLTKEEVLAVQDTKIQTVEVPEWGGAVCVKEMNGVERDDYASWLTANLSDDGVRAKEQRTAMKMKLLSLTVCDEAGNPLFAESDFDALSKKSGAALLRVFAVAMDLNGMSEKAREEIRKNSTRASDGSGSASPAASECPSPEPSAK